MSQSKHSVSEAALIAALQREAEATPEDARERVVLRLSQTLALAPGILPLASTLSEAASTAGAASSSLAPAASGTSAALSSTSAAASSAATAVKVAAGSAAGSAAVASGGGLLAALSQPIAIVAMSTVVGTGALAGISAITSPVPRPATSASLPPARSGAASPPARAPRAALSPDPRPILPVETAPSTEEAPEPSVPGHAPRAAKTGRGFAPAPAPVNSGSAAIASVPAATPAEHSLRDQQVLLDAARRALARSDGSAALEALGWHRARFPQTQLAEEREALTIKALRAAGRSAEANERAWQFAQRYPHSVFSSGVVESSESNP